MTKATRLNEVQLILLTTAASRENGSLLPPPATLGDVPIRISKAVTALICRGLAHEVDIEHEPDAWRTEGDRKIGVAITDPGREAIGIELAPEEATNANVENVEPLALPPEPVPRDKAQTKAALVLAMLEREGGATLDELTSATSWLPHTTRAALTGLRKKGHDIDQRKRGDVTCYHLAQA